MSNDPLSELASVARPHMATRPIHREDSSAGDAVAWVAYLVGWITFLLGIAGAVYSGMHLIQLAFADPREAPRTADASVYAYQLGSSIACLWMSVVVWLLAGIYRRLRN